MKKETENSGPKQTCKTLKNIQTDPQLDQYLVMIVVNTFLLHVTAFINAVTFKALSVL